MVSSNPEIFLHRSKFKKEEYRSQQLSIQKQRTEVPRHERVMCSKPRQFVGHIAGSMHYSGEHMYQCCSMPTESRSIRPVSMRDWPGKQVPMRYRLQLRCRKFNFLNSRHTWNHYQNHFNIFEDDTKLTATERCIQNATPSHHHHYFDTNTRRQ